MCSVRNKSSESSNFRMWANWCSDDAGSDRNVRWSGLNIAAMVFGFILFWPVGLFVLFWILSGRQAAELPGAMRNLWASLFGGERIHAGGSDNVVFNEYQQTQFDRIRELKEEIRSRAKRFGEFRMDAKRRADQEEFDRFMSSSPGSNNGPVNG